jgi:hypothetical protein
MDHSPRRSSRLNKGKQPAREQRLVSEDSFASAQPHAVDSNATYDEDLPYQPHQPEHNYRGTYVDQQIPEQRSYRPQSQYQPSPEAHVGPPHNPRQYGAGEAEDIYEKSWDPVDADLAQFGGTRHLPRAPSEAQDGSPLQSLQQLGLEVQQMLQDTYQPSHHAQTSLTQSLSSSSRPLENGSFPTAQSLLSPPSDSQAPLNAPNRQSPSNLAHRTDATHLPDPTQQPSRVRASERHPDHGWEPIAVQILDEQVELNRLLAPIRKVCQERLHKDQMRAGDNTLFMLSKLLFKTTKTYYDLPSEAAANAILVSENQALEALEVRESCYRNMMTVQNSMDEHLLVNEFTGTQDEFLVLKGLIEVRKLRLAQRMQEPLAKAALRAYIRTLGRLGRGPAADEYSRRSPIQSNNNVAAGRSGTATSTHSPRDPRDPRGMGTEKRYMCYLPDEVYTAERGRLFPRLQDVRRHMSLRHPSEKFEPERCPEVMVYRDSGEPVDPLPRRENDAGDDTATGSRRVSSITAQHEATRISSTPGRTFAVPRQRDRSGQSSHNRLARHAMRQASSSARHHDGGSNGTRSTSSPMPTTPTRLGRRISRGSLARGPLDNFNAQAEVDEGGVDAQAEVERSSPETFDSLLAKQAELDNGLIDPAMIPLPSDDQALTEHINAGLDWNWENEIDWDNLDLGIEVSGHNTGPQVLANSAQGIDPQSGTVTGLGLNAATYASTEWQAPVPSTTLSTPTTPIRQATNAAPGTSPVEVARTPGSSRKRPGAVGEGSNGGVGESESESAKRRRLAPEDGFQEGVPSGSGGGLPLDWGILGDDHTDEPLLPDWFGDYVADMEPEV